MKRFGYILLVVVVFLSLTAVNVFAGEVNKAKEAEIEFANAVAQYSDCDLNIDAKTVSDEEMKSVVGEGAIHVANCIKKIVKKIHSKDSTIKKVLYVTAKSAEIVTDVAQIFTGWGAIAFCLETVSEAVVEATKD